ncbi:MAG: T9SS type A sorting domain-containing protein [Chitinophagaceae bacterium]
MRLFLLFALFIAFSLPGIAQQCVSLGCADTYTITTDGSQPDQPSGPEWGCYNGYPRKQTIWQYFYSDMGGYYTQTFACAADLDWLVFDMGSSFAAMNCPVDPSPWTQVGCDLSYNPGGPTGPGLESNVMTTAGHYYAVAIILWEPLDLTFTFGNPQVGSKNLSAANCLTVLPVNNLQLTAKPVNGNALLHWTVTDEINITRYEVQGSTDGLHWNTGGSTAASGQSRYQFSYSNAVSSGLLYYRLRIVSSNGKITFSDIVTIDSQSATTPRIIDNPVGGILHISGLAGNGSLRVMDMAGKTLVNQPVNNTTVSMNVYNWLPGLYVVQYIQGNKIWVEKFVKK